ncbi:MAG: hypothetical protein U1F36_00315 [Planctomycetota bacterium]
MRRLRATFLLHLVVFLAVVAICVGTILLGLGTAWIAGACVFAALSWFVGVELGLIEHLIVQRAQRRGGAVSRMWFVDEDEERRQRLDAFIEDTEDNPTIR